MKLDDWVGKVKATMAARKLELFNGEGGKVVEANDGLCCGNESLREVTDHGSKNGAGENAHVNVQPNSEATH